MLSLWCVGFVLIGCSRTTPAPTGPSPTCFPKMWDPQPLGALPAGTRSATMSMKTDRAAVCRWGEVEGVNYVELPHQFETTGGTQHSTPISGLTDGSYYRWYAKCEVPGTGCMTPHDLVFVFNVSRP